MKQNQTLVWIDLEMTGLIPERDVILEIATIVTDNDLRIIKEGPEFVLHADAPQLAAMNDEVTALHTTSGLIDHVRESTITLEHAQDETIKFLKKYAIPNSPLCGNSVYNDRNFLAKYMPKVMNYFHYRLIDVSTIKVLVKRWYPNDPHIRFKKKDTHRALTDIRESIEELKHFRKYFFVSSFSS